MWTKFSSAALLILLISTSLHFYGRSFTNFFFQDDFFNITLSQSQSIIQSFNIFSKPILDFYFFRPLTTQLFWGVTFPVFGWNVAPYHLIVSIFFAINIFFIYWLSTLLTDKKPIALLTTFLYAFSATHFHRLFFLSQFQEIGLTTFVLLTIISYIKNSKLSLVFFILALTSKETAVVTPIFLLVFSVLSSRKQYRLLALHFLILGVYLFLRFTFFGFASGGPYTYDFNPLHVINNYVWYGLWALGIPESFVNLKLFFVNRYDDLGQWQSFSFINPDIFTAFGIWGGPIILVFALLLLTLILALNKKNWTHFFRRESIFASMIFIIFLLPVAFFPFHKFAYSLTLPAIGLSLFLANLLINFSLRFQILSLVFFIALSFFTTQYNVSEHWAVKKAIVAKLAWEYFRQNHPENITADNIYFRNTDAPYCSILKNKFKPSQEVAYGLGGADSLRLLYNNPELKVYFEDFDDNHHLMADSLMIDSRQFLP
ncbi:MAG: hypothetical protein UY21_C0001G0046 [Microgenomates group bacterium GW2011_GWA1_48_10]|nr:MAG: hypothetical protein UY21_C0001G0046 [Microgenomates group bacterium GW2011_GWA1_48_10]